MVYDTPTFVANYLRQSSLYNPTWNTQKHLIFSLPNPFWDSKPELFSDIACLWIPYKPCIVLFGNFFSGTPASNRRELRLHLNVVPTGAGVFKSRHILLHKYVNRIMIIYPAMKPDTAHHSQPPLQIYWMSSFWLVLKVCHVIAFSTNYVI
jgi:hypothetical protein